MPIAPARGHERRSLRPVRARRCPRRSLPQCSSHRPLRESPRLPLRHIASRYA
jgi:hypothetical protein